MIRDPRAFSTVFLLLLIYTVGKGWALYLPKASWVEGTRFAGLAPILNFVNPGPFRIKEVSFRWRMSDDGANRVRSTSLRRSWHPPRLAVAPQSRTSLFNA